MKPKLPVFFLFSILTISAIGFLLLKNPENEKKFAPSIKKPNNFSWINERPAENNVQRKPSGEMSPETCSSKESNTASLREQLPDLNTGTLRRYRFLRRGRLIKEKFIENTNGDIFKHIRIFKTDFKYPLIRVEETIHWGRDDRTPVTTSAMVATHVLAKLKPGVTTRELENALDPIGARVAKQLKLSKVLLIEFEGDPIESFEMVLNSLKKRSDIVDVQPDYILSKN